MKHKLLRHELEIWKAQQLKKQNGRCLICTETFHEKKPPRADHSHQTGELRALLCNSCNLGLGAFRDNIDLLISAVVYLQLFGSVATGEVPRRRKMYRSLTPINALRQTAEMFSVDPKQLKDALQKVV